MPIPGAGAGTNEWTAWGHSGNPVDQRNVGQSWYRNPSWGGHVVYNPQYGYQDYPTIEKMYSQAQSPMDDQAFGQAFEGAGMQKHLGGTWGTHYGNDPKHRIVSHQEKMMNQYGTPYNPYGAAAQQGGYGPQYQMPGQQGQQQQQMQTQPYGGYNSMYQQPPSMGGYNNLTMGGDPSTWAPTQGGYGQQPTQSGHEMLPYMDYQQAHQNYAGTQPAPPLGKNQGYDIPQGQQQQQQPQQYYKPQKPSAKGTSWWR